MTELKDKDEQYNVFLKYYESEKEEKKSADKSLFSLVIIMLAISLSVFLVFLYNADSNFSSKINGIFSSFDTKMLVKKNKIVKAAKETQIDKTIKKNKKNFKVQFLNRRQNILLLGVDCNKNCPDPFKGTRSDTIILINIDPKDKSVNAISIPRDSKVYIADNHGIQKINSAHSLGGIELTKKTIEDTLGIRINNYLIVNNEGIKKLVDAIGGVPLYIEKDMYYNDYAGDLHINLAKGLRVLDGHDVEGYLRFRKDGLGDIGRTSRQQWFLKALMEKLQTHEAITKIPDALKIANAYIKTDLNLYQLSQYATLAREIDIDDIEVATLPGRPNKKGYVSYWILDPEKTQEIIDRMVYREKPNYNNRNKNLKAGIMYSFDKEEEAMEIKEKLQKSGYEVNCIGRARLPHSQVIGHDSAVTSDFVNWLKKKIPELRHSQFVYDPVRTYCVKSDFTVVVAGS